MINTLPGQSPRTLLSILDTVDPVLLEVKEAINHVNSLVDLDKRVKILAQVNATGDTVFTLVLKNIPRVMPELLLLIGTLAVEAQEKIFTHASTYISYADNKFYGNMKERFNALGLIAVKCPQAYPAALELICKFSFQTQRDLFNLMQGERYYPLFLRLAERAPEVIPKALKILKTFPKEIQAATIYKKHKKEEGFEWAIIDSGDTTVLKEVVAMGFIFDTKGLFRSLIHGNNINMLKVLISEFGVKPDQETIDYVAKVMKRFPDKKLFPLDVINFFKDTAGINALYNIYLRSLNPFVTAEINSVMVPLKNNMPMEVISIISAYSLEDALVENIEQALKLRVKLLNPLFDYCLQKDLDVEAKNLLKGLLDSKRLAPLILEQELSGLLTQERFSEKAYASSIIKCRLNTTETTKNKFIPSGKNKVIQEVVELKLKNQHESSAFMFKVLCSCFVMSGISLVLGFLALNIGTGIVGIALLTSASPLLNLQLPSESFAFQLAALHTSTILSCIGLIVGLLGIVINVCLTILTIPALVVSAVALAGNAYGFYAQKKNMEVHRVEGEVETMPSAIPA